MFVIFQQLLPTASVRNVRRRKRRICNLILGRTGFIGKDISVKKHEREPLGLAVKGIGIYHPFANFNRCNVVSIMKTRNASLNNQVALN